MSGKILENEYRYNKRFRQYVDEYAKNNHITVSQAMEHEPVRQAYLWYAET